MWAPVRFAGAGATAACSPLGAHTVRVTRALDDGTMVSIGNGTDGRVVCARRVAADAAMREPEERLAGNEARRCQPLARFA